jgi:hypothetical protein
MPYFVTEYKSIKSKLFYSEILPEPFIIYSNDHDCTLSRVVIHVNDTVLPGGKTVPTPASSIIQTYKNSSPTKSFSWTNVALSLHVILMTKQPYGMVYIKRQ